MDEDRIRTPDWAAERIASIAGDIVDAIAASGVRVIGDLERLRSSGDGSAGSRSGWNGAGWPEIAAASSMGVLLATGQARGRPRRHEEGWDDGVAVTAESSIAGLSLLPGADDEAVDLNNVSTQRLRKAFTTRLRRSVRPGRRRRGARTAAVSDDEAAAIDDVIEPEMASIHSAGEVE
jgi:hypothetical protein